MAYTLFLWGKRRVRIDEDILTHSCSIYSWKFEIYLLASFYIEGKTRARDAALNAIQSPLLDIGIERATGIVWNITGGSDLTLFEVASYPSVPFTNFNFARYLFHLYTYMMFSPPSFFLSFSFLFWKTILPFSFGIWVI